MLSPGAEDAVDGGGGDRPRDGSLSGAGAGGHSRDSDDDENGMEEEDGMEEEEDGIEEEEDGIEEEDEEEDSDWEEEDEDDDESMDGDWVGGAAFGGSDDEGTTSGSSDAELDEGRPEGEGGRACALCPPSGSGSSLAPSSQRLVGEAFYERVRVGAGWNHPQCCASLAAHGRTVATVEGELLSLHLLPPLPGDIFSAAKSAQAGEFPRGAHLGVASALLRGENYSVDLDDAFCVASAYDEVVLFRLPPCLASGGGEVEAPPEGGVRAPLRLRPAAEVPILNMNNSVRLCRLDPTGCGTPERWLCVANQDTSIYLVRVDAALQAAALQESETSASAMRDLVARGIKGLCPGDFRRMGPFPKELNCAVVSPCGTRVLAAGDSYSVYVAPIGAMELKEGDVEGTSAQSVSAERERQEGLDPGVPLVRALTFPGIVGVDDGRSSGGGGGGGGGGGDGASGGTTGGGAAADADDDEDEFQGDALPPGCQYCAWSPDGRFVAASSDNIKAVAVWDLGGGDEGLAPPRSRQGIQVAGVPVGVWGPHRRACLPLVFSPLDPDVLLYGEDRQRVWAVRVSDGPAARAQRIVCPTDPAPIVCLSPGCASRPAVGPCLHVPWHGGTGPTVADGLPVDVDVGPMNDPPGFTRGGDPQRVIVRAIVLSIGELWWDAHALPELEGMDVTLGKPHAANQRSAVGHGAMLLEMVSVDPYIASLTAENRPPPDPDAVSHRFAAVGLMVPLAHARKFRLDLISRAEDRQRHEIREIVGVWLRDCFAAQFPAVHAALQTTEAPDMTPPGVRAAAQAARSALTAHLETVLVARFLWIAAQHGAARRRITGLVATPEHGLLVSFLDRLVRYPLLPTSLDPVLEAQAQAAFEAEDKGRPRGQVVVGGGLQALARSAGRPGSTLCRFPPRYRAAVCTLARAAQPSDGRRERDVPEGATQLADLPDALLARIAAEAAFPLHAW